MRFLRAAMLAAAILALLVRCLSIAEPLGIDQSLWASAVRGLARGQRLYRDVWEQRPPGIYWIYLTGFRIFGWTPAAIAWLDILASSATTALLYAIGRKLATPIAGACAAALYAVLTMPAWLYGHGGFLERSVCETFIVVSVGLSAWCAVGFRERASATSAFALGVFAGAAVVFKPNAGLYFPALLVWMSLYRRDSPGSGRRFVQPLAWAAAGAAVVPAAAFLWLWRLGLLHDARVAVIDFNRFYVSQGFSVGGYALDFSKSIWLRIKTDPLWFGAAVATVVAAWDVTRRRRLPPLAGLAIAWGAAGALVMIVNGARLFNSYFMQVFPPLALITAWLVTEGGDESAIRRAIGVATAALMAVLMLTRQYPARVLEWARADAAALRGSMDRMTYLDRFGGYGNARGYSARANEELADYVRAHTAPDERIFLFGISGAGVYFGADRLTAHRFLRANFFVATDFPDPSFRLPRVVADLAERRPRYLIFERLNSLSEMGRAVDRLPDDPDVARLLTAYGREAQIEDFTLYRRLD
ncbi:MAG TPA: glycosyltransferase family 39 protein [Vicinamibacterales bacterium]|nr:glycosyltransferase family 39 protein [Vicinamibacterales bacterium]